MKIVVTASSPELSSHVDPRFGRCSYFLFIDKETMQFESVENPHFNSASGAGIQSAQLVAEKGAEVVLTGSCGPNAFQTLQAAGIEVIMGVTGVIQDAVEQYKTGQLCPASQPNVPPHFGMRGISSQGSGFGDQRGMARGLGGGRRGGMGQGMGYGIPPQAPGMPPMNQGMPQLSKEEELQHLRQQAELLRKQVETITKRIKDLEKKKKI